MAAADANYVKALTTYIKGLAPRQQCEFVVIASKYLYIHDQGDVPPLLTGSLTELDAPFLRGKYSARVVNQTIDGVVKEVSIKDALDKLMSVCTDEKREGMVDKKIAALSAKEPRPTVKEFQGIFEPPAAPATTTTTKAPAVEANWWNSFFPTTTTKRPAAERRNPCGDGAAPFKGLRPDLQASCLNLEGLNEYIAGLYPADQGSYKIEDGTNNLKRGLRGCTDRGIIGGWKNMYSSGTHHDCLIHSFLTATCNAFRKLTPEHKVLVACNFRRTFLPTTQAARAMRPDLQDELGRVPGGGDAFLGNEHVTLLSQIYHIDFLVLEADGGMFFEMNNSPRVFIILNPGNGHYESVRPRPGDNADFSISREEAQRAFECISPELIAAGHVRKGISQTICLPVGTHVQYSGRPYVILDSEIDREENRNGRLIRQSCRGYYLSTPDQLAAFTALPNSFNEGGRRIFKEETAVKRRYLSFSRLIPAGEVQTRAALPAPPPHAVAAPPPANTNAVNPYNFPEDRNGYIATMMTMPLANALQKNGTAEEDLRGLFGREWNSAWGAAGGSRRRRSLRPRRRHTSKGHGSRRKH